MLPDHARARKGVPAESNAISLLNIVPLIFQCFVVHCGEFGGGQKEGGKLLVEGMNRDLKAKNLEISNSMFLVCFGELSTLAFMESASSAFADGCDGFTTSSTRA